MKASEMLPEGRPQAGTSELNTGFLDSFRSLWNTDVPVMGKSSLPQVRFAK